RSRSSCAGPTRRPTSCAIPPRDACPHCSSASLRSGTAWPSLNISPRSTPKPNCGPLHSLPARSPAPHRPRCTRALLRCGNTVPWIWSHDCPWPGCRIRLRPRYGAFWHCGVTAAAAMADRAPFCSAPSRPPMPCTHPLPLAFAPYLPDLRPYGDDGTATAYMAALFALPAMLAWEKAARLDAAGGEPLGANLPSTRGYSLVAHTPRVAH